MHASNSSRHHRLGLPMLSALAIAVFLVLAGLVLAGVAPDGADAKTSAGGTLSGSTSQGNPGRITLSRSGRTIKEASVTVSVKCPFGPLLLPQKVRSVSVTPQGRFRATLEDSSVEEGVALRLFESFSGKFSADRTSVVAKSRIYLHFENPDGSVEDCDSGSVTLRAHR